MKNSKKHNLILFLLSSFVFNEIRTNDDILTSDSIEKIDIYNFKSALIFGITAQDGAYLTKFLLKMGYKVYGAVRRSTVPNTHRLDHILKNEKPELKKNLILLYGDVTDFPAVFKIINIVKPDEIYNLAAQ